jgi:hypothetical protein
MPTGLHLDWVRTLTVALGLAPFGAYAQPLQPAPDLPLELIEVILDDDLQIGRFRFLAPGIAARDFDMETLQPLFDHLCNEVAAPDLRAARPDWEEVVISISSVAIAFGESDPEVAQAFEGYLIDAEGCIWQEF